MYNYHTNDSLAGAKITRDQVIAALVIILGGHISSLATSIRYGFLAISFGERGISGRVYGLVEGSIFFGYVASFLCRGYWDKCSERLTPKWTISIMLACQIIACTMSGLAQYSSNNTVFVLVSILAKMLVGYTAFPQSICCLDMLKTLFPNKFDLLNGLMNMGHYSGHGVGEYIGTLLFSNYGYQVPFLFATLYLVVAGLLSACVLPAIPSILCTDTQSRHSQREEVHTSVTPFVMLPMCVCMLINCVYAYLQIAICPYLVDVFDIPISVGGTVLIAISAGVAIGSSLSGGLSQSGIINTYIQMAIGAGMVGLGLVLMFPTSSIPFLYNNVPYIAYPAAIISGIGDPIMTIPTLRAMTDLQTMLKRRCTGKNSISIFGVWMMASQCSNYSGALVGGVMMEFLTYQNGAYILVTFCALSLVGSLFLKCAVSSYECQSTDEEKAPMIT